MNIQLNLFWISFRYSNKLNLWLVHLWNKVFYMDVKELFTMVKLWSLIHICVTTRSSIIQEFEKLATVSALNCCSTGTFHSSKTTLGRTCLSCMSVLQDNENATLKHGRVVPRTPDLPFPFWHSGIWSANTDWYFSDFQRTFSSHEFLIAKFKHSFQNFWRHQPV